MPPEAPTNGGTGREPDPGSGPARTPDAPTPAPMPESEGNHKPRRKRRPRFVLEESEDAIPRAACRALTATYLCVPSPI